MLAFVDVATGHRTTYRADDGVGDRIVFSPDGTLVATSDGTDHVRVWDRATCRSQRLVGDNVGGAKIEVSRRLPLFPVRPSPHAGSLPRPTPPSSPPTHP